MNQNVRLGLMGLSLLLSLIGTTVHAGHTACGLVSSEITDADSSAATCDVSFTATPTFSCNAAFPQTGIYTISNNTPVTMQLNYIRIQNNENRPTSDVRITANTCGTALAAGASCNITLRLANEGPFNRILQIGVDSRQVQLNSPVITPTTGCNVPTPGLPSVPPFTCDLGTTSSFATLAGTTITNTGPTLLNGNLGLSPGTSVTGFPPGTVNGTQHIANATAATAQADLTSLYTCLAALPCSALIGTADQAGTTLSADAGAQRVFCSDSSVLNSGVLTLYGDATSVIIIQAGSTLTMGPGASIVLTGGLQPGNVFWQVGSSATLDLNSTMQGTIVALSSMTMNNGATLLGRALARDGAVSFDTNTVTLP